MRKPNAIQKLLHRFFMLPSITAFFAPRVHLIDQAILSLTRGKWTATEILGWNIIQLTTVGAKTKQPRTMPLMGMFDQEKIALIASSFGRKHNPGWYYNLTAHPECEVRFNGHSGIYLAREAMGEEYDLYWQMAVSFYEGYEKYQQRAAHRHIPVMVLEPKK
ncbi:MAG TPA: nitroreductase family deazaflavin-dependent oxidoreductase [Anaerolineales bacterium]|nr:nitroreductase family deazaflavin-dependent oxidoreductase [Anaerolineales bacterium]